MKNSTLALLLMNLLAAGAAEGSALAIRSTSSEMIVVSLDQGDYSLPGQAVEFHDLAPGNHFLRVSRLAPGHSQGNGHAYGNARRQEIFRGNIYVPVATRMDAEVSRRRLVVVAWEHLPEILIPCETPVAMNDFMFRRLLTSIAGKSFESTRLSLAREAANNNFFTSCQVAEMLSLFTFESTKLEFAKFAYARTLDPQNFFLVYDAFTFESSIAELQSSIQATGTGHRPRS